MMHSLLLHAKCCVPAGMSAKAPTLISCPAATSSLGPVPMLNEPEITVIPSAVGWVCAGILNPAGVLRRIVNGPSLPGSPSRTAILAPAGNDGGASLHF